MATWERDAQLIEAEIRRTRADLSDTVEELGSRLRPGHLVGEAKETLKAAATERIHDVVHAASEMTNDVATRTREVAAIATERLRVDSMQAALLGAGLGLLAWALVSGLPKRRYTLMTLAAAGTGAWWLSQNPGSPLSDERDGEWPEPNPMDSSTPLDTASATPIEQAPPIQAPTPIETPTPIAPVTGTSRPVDPMID